MGGKGVRVLLLKSAII